MYRAVGAAAAVWVWSMACLAVAAATTGGASLPRVVRLTRQTQAMPPGSEDSVFLTGSPERNAAYTAEVTVGSPPQRFQLAVDTRAAVVAVHGLGCVGCNTGATARLDVLRLSPPAGSRQCTPTDLSQCPVVADDVAQQCFGLVCGFSITYSDDGVIQGKWYTTSVAVGNALLLPSTVVGAVSFASGSVSSLAADGVLGLAPDGLPSSLATSTAVHDSAFSVCFGRSHGLLVFGEPATNLHVPGAPPVEMELSVDDTAFTVELQSIGFDDGSRTAQPSVVNAVVDSASSVTFLPAVYVSHIVDTLTTTCAQPTACLGTAVPHDGEALCVDIGSDSNDAAALSSFPSLSLFFSGGAELTVPATGLFTHRPWSDTVRCLAVFSSESNMAVLGSNVFLDRDVVFNWQAGNLQVFPAAQCDDVTQVPAQSAAASPSPSPSPGTAASPSPSPGASALPSPSPVGSDGTTAPPSLSHGRLSPALLAGVLAGAGLVAAVVVAAVCYVAVCNGRLRLGSFVMQVPQVAGATATPHGGRLAFDPVHSQSDDDEDNGAGVALRPRRRDRSRRPGGVRRAAPSSRRYADVASGSDSGSGGAAHAHDDVEARAPYHDHDGGSGASMGSGSDIDLGLGVLADDDHVGPAGSDGYSSDGGSSMGSGDVAALEALAAAVERGQAAVNYDADEEVEV